MYAESDDPWGFTSRWYERRKYAITLAMLPHEHYPDAFEPGCRDVCHRPGWGRVAGSGHGNAEMGARHAE